MIKENAANHLLALQGEQDLDGLGKIIRPLSPKGRNNPQSLARNVRREPVAGRPRRSCGLPYC